MKCIEREQIEEKREIGWERDLNSEIEVF